MDNLQKVEQEAKQAFQKGDFASAKRLFAQAVTLAQSVTPPDDLYLAQLLNNLGFVCQRLKDLPSAQTYFEKAHQIYRTHKSGDSPEFALTLHNLGRTAYMQRDSKTAWNYWTQELDMWTRLKNPGCNHYLASCLQSCADVMADAGEYTGARRNLEQALGLRTTVLPPNHPDIADNLMALGQLCEAQSDHPAARTYFQKALPLFLSALGGNHPVVKELQSSLKRLS